MRGDALTDRQQDVLDKIREHIKRDRPAAFAVGTSAQPRVRALLGSQTPSDMRSRRRAGSRFKPGVWTAESTC